MRPLGFASPLIVWNDDLPAVQFRTCFQGYGGKVIFIGRLIHGLSGDEDEVVAVAVLAVAPAFDYSDVFA